MASRRPPPPPPPMDDPSPPPSEDDMSDAPPSDEDPPSDDEFPPSGEEDGPPSDGPPDDEPSDFDEDPDDIPGSISDGPPLDDEDGMMSGPDDGDSMDSPPGSDEDPDFDPDDDEDPDFDPDDDEDPDGEGPEDVNDDEPPDSDPDFDPPDDDEDPDFDPDEDPDEDPDDDDEDDFPPPPPPQVGNGKFNLPVAVPNKPALGGGSSNDKQKKPPTTKGSNNVPELSLGLAIKEAPKILKKQGGGLGSLPPPPMSPTDGGPPSDFGSPSDSDMGPPPASDSDMDEDIEEEGEDEKVVVSEETRLLRAQIAKIVAENNYIPAKGKFDGDPFEDLWVRIDTKTNVLYVLVETGQEVDFDLLNHSFVFEDTNDPTTFILDHRKTIVVFKVDSVNELNSIMKKMPPAVFMVADLNDQEEKLLKEGGHDDASTTSGAKKQHAGTKLSLKPTAAQQNRVKGTSVEELLENEFEGGTKWEQHEVDELFSAKSQAPSFPQYKDPERRKELIDSYIRKPKYSVRRVGLVCEWINSLHIWATPVTINTLHKEMCNGLLLSRIVKVVNPNVQFLNINEQPRAKKPALENLEQAIGHLWRSKALNTTRIPSALEIYNGNTSKIAILLNEMFTVYVLKPILKSAIKILKWFHQILKQYFMPLPKAIFEEGDLSGLWPHFQSGVAMFCVLYHLFGPNLIGADSIKEGMSTVSLGGLGGPVESRSRAAPGAGVRVDPLRIAGNPSSLSDYRENCTYVFTLLTALGIDVMWTPEDWITNPDTEFVLLQLGYVYEALKHKQCSLPPAHGGNPGLSAGPNGEPIVSGVIFKDSRPLHSRVVVLERKTVLLGEDSGSIPLIPVDRAGKSGRFINSTICPRGMLASTVSANAVPQIEVALKEVKLYADKSQWNKSAMVDSEKYSYVNGHVLTLLHENTKRNADGSMPNKTLGPNLKPESPTKMGRSRASQSPKKPVYDDEKVAVFTGKFSGAGSLVPGGRDLVGVDVTVQGTAEQRKKEVDKALKDLEKEMALSESQLNTLEEDLANRYIDLEATAEAVDIEEYEAVLDVLERERLDLEDEKMKMQDHFARKLNAIKGTYLDSHEGSGSDFVHSNMGGGGVGESKSNQNNNGIISGGDSVMSLSSINGGRRKGGKMTAEEKEKERKRVELAEKSWIKVAKNTTHNFHLKNRQAESSNKLKAVWTPKALKQKEKEREAAVRDRMVQSGIATSPVKNTKDSLTVYAEAGDVSSLSRRGGRGIVGGAGVGGFGAAGGVNDSVHEASELHMAAALAAVGGKIPEEIVDKPVLVSFHKFKVRLHVASVQFMEKKNKAERVRLRDLMQASAVKQTALIALPTKSQAELDELQQQQEQAEFENYWQQLRDDELDRMQYEDSRRREVLNDEKVQAQLSVLTKNTNKRGMTRNNSSRGTPTDSEIMQESTRNTANNTPRDDASSVYSQSQSRAAAAVLAKPSTAEMDSSFKWLNTPRVITIAERVSKEFTFMLTVVEAPAPVINSRPNSPGKKKPVPMLCYVLEWREKGESIHQPALGSVDLDDIAEIISVSSKANADPCMLTLLLNESPRSLKGSRGRTSIPLRCSTPGECIKCVQSINNLRRASNPSLTADGKRSDM